MSGWLAAGTVFMIHGAGGGGWEYDFWKPVWAQAGWTVIARDLVPSEQGLAKTTYADYETQVRRWTERAPRPWVVVGASLGGILALTTQDDIRPDAIILVNPAPPANFRPPTSNPPNLEIIRWANGPLKDTEDAMPDSDRATILWAWKRWRDESGSVLNTVQAGLPVEPVAAPVLMIIGTADTDIDPTVSYRLGRSLGATLSVYRGMSHVGPLMGTRAARVAQEALDWTKRRLSAPASN